MIDGARFRELTLWWKVVPPKSVTVWCMGDSSKAPQPRIKGRTPGEAFSGIIYSWNITQCSQGKKSSSGFELVASLWASTASKLSRARAEAKLWSRWSAAFFCEAGPSWNFLICSKQFKRGAIASTSYFNNDTFYFDIDTFCIELGLRK